MVLPNLGAMKVVFQLFAMCDRFATEDRTAESYDATLQITLKLLLHLVENCDVQFPPHAAASFETLRVCLGMQYFHMLKRCSKSTFHFYFLLM